MDSITERGRADDNSSLRTKDRHQGLSPGFPTADHHYVEPVNRTSGGIEVVHDDDHGQKRVVLHAYMFHINLATSNATETVLPVCNETRRVLAQIDRDLRQEQPKSGLSLLVAEKEKESTMSDQKRKSRDH